MINVIEYSSVDFDRREPPAFTGGQRVQRVAAGPRTRIYRDLVDPLVLVVEVGEKVLEVPFSRVTTARRKPPLVKGK
jgi:hypothetical protein